jgi:hypothetical protein
VAYKPGYPGEGCHRQTGLKPGEFVVRGSIQITGSAQLSAADKDSSANNKEELSATMTSEARYLVEWLGNSVVSGNELSASSSANVEGAGTYVVTSKGMTFVGTRTFQLNPNFDPNQSYVAGSFDSAFGYCGASINWPPVESSGDGSPWDAAIDVAAQAWAKAGDFQFEPPPGNQGFTMTKSQTGSASTDFPNGSAHGSATVTMTVEYTPDVNCQSKVDALSQGDPRWRSNPYDSSSTKTIWGVGCALTSLAMAVNAALATAGSGDQYDPGSFNNLLNSNNGFNGLNVLWDPAVRAAASQTRTKMHFSTQFKGSSSEADLRSLLCRGDKGKPAPVVVGVKLDQRGVPGHFVLVTGMQNGQFTIADPAGYPKPQCSTLSCYGNKFSIRGCVSDPEDMSGLDLAAGAAAEVLLIDPQGRRTGFDPSTGKDCEEIPNSAYFRDRLDDDLTGEIDSNVSHSVQCYQPVAGAYQVILTGVQSGPFALDVLGFNRDGSSQRPLLIQGTATVGGTNSFSVAYDPGPEQKSLRFGTLAFLTNGAFSLQFFGTSGQSYILQISTNLADWNDISRIVAAEGTNSVVDSAAGKFGRRFYRLVNGP